MSDNYSLHVRIGDAEFNAEGPEQTVTDAYQAFLKAISEGAVERASHSSLEDREGGDDHAPDAETVRTELLHKAFKVEDDDVVSLRILPKGDGKQQKADAAILAIYGFQEMLDMEHAPVTKLNEGLRQSGLSINRLDRFIGTHDTLFRKGGTRSGGRYMLTNRGKRWAADKLREMFGNG